MVGYVSMIAVNLYHMYHTLLSHTYHKYGVRIRSIENNYEDDDDDDADGDDVIICYGKLDIMDNTSMQISR